MNVRETSKVISRVTRALIIALVCGTVFWQLDTSQVPLRNGCFTKALILTGWGTFPLRRDYRSSWLHWLRWA